jgi:hypothetical protein
MESDAKKYFLCVSIVYPIKIIKKLESNSKSRQSLAHHLHQHPLWSASVGIVKLSSDELPSQDDVIRRRFDRAHNNNTAYL